MSADWPEYPLLDVYSVTNGLNKSRSEFGFGHPFLTFKEVFYNYFVPDELVSLANTTPKERDKYSVQAGDVFITRTSETFEELGISCVALKDYPNAAFNGFCKRLRPKGTVIVDPKYSAFFFKGPEFRQQVLSLTNMSTRASLNNDMLKRLTIKLPPLHVQQRVATVLSDLHDKIQLNHQINQTLEQMAQAIFKSWFVDFEPVTAKIAALEAGGSSADAELAAMQAISGKGADQLAQMTTEQPEQYAKLQATAALFPSAMQSSELGEIPEGWLPKRIGDVIDRLPVGKKYSQKTASETGSVPVLDQGKSGIIGYHDDKPGVLASTEDPIIVFANHTCYMRLIMHDFSAIQNVLPFKGKGLDIYWTYYATLGKQAFVEYKGHWPDFVIKDVVVPLNELDQRFGKLVSSLSHMSYQNEQQNRSLSDLRDSLLPMLLSGELTLNDVEEQNAQVAV